MSSVVLLAHGSADPRSGAAVREAAAAVAGRTGVRVDAAFLDHDERDLRTVVDALAADEEVVVLPLLLSTAYHARVDVPTAVAALEREVVLLDPVGHPASVLDDLLRRAARPVVVVGAGTRVDEERAAFATAVTAASVRTHVPAVAAYATGPGRRVAEATRPGGSEVVPWLLAPGRLLDGVEASAREHGCRTVGTWLLREESLLEEIAIRVRRAPAASVPSHT